jgi:hypothetical protein
MGQFKVRNYLNATTYANHMANEKQSFWYAMFPFIKIGKLENWILIKIY